MFFISKGDGHRLITDRLLPPEGYRVPSADEYELFNYSYNQNQNKMDHQPDGRAALSQERQATGVDQYRSPTTKDRIRTINIQQVDRGYIVTVGCQTVVIERTGTLIDKLTKYLCNPHRTEEEFEQGRLFD